MRVDILTLFPEIMRPYLAASMLGRAQRADLVQIHLHQLRDYTTDPHKKVDDRPFGGGPGMILSCQPVCDAVEAIESLDPRPARRILLSPQGRTFTQTIANEYAESARLLLICGHYEGFDQRILDILRPEELSIGNYVLTGGEIPALAVVDAVVRLLPGVVGHPDATASESFQGELLDHPQYTRPRDFRGLLVPEVLFSGNHAEIAAWRRQQAARRTQESRPDLLRKQRGESEDADGHSGREARSRPESKAALEASSAARAARQRASVTNHTPACPALTMS
jgi:tRNA (guanine37-N1)-methyltransferase